MEEKIKADNIIIILEQRRIRLFGLVDIVNGVEKQIEEIKKKYTSNTVKLTIEANQVKKMFLKLTIKSFYFL